MPKIGIPSYGAAFNAPGASDGVLAMALSSRPYPVGWSVVSADRAFNILEAA